MIATIYDTVFNIWNQTYFEIFKMLTNGGYLNFFLIATLIPLILWILFYFVWKYPYGKWWHWLIYLFFINIIVFGFTYSVANITILASNDDFMIDCFNDPYCLAYAETLPIRFAMWNLLLATLVSIIYSLIMKQFSKIQAHLPF